ncbi:MAG: hypothetical protein GC200_08980 [Tepidisphaera sp.]|nr:hypothetical protein [Tepidisphaera sp.]
MKTEIKLEIQAQPDDVTCGPSCLYSIYRHLGDKTITLRQVIDQIEKLDHGGTLIEVLACHGLKRGLHATIYSYHVDLLDPTWFAEDGGVHDRDYVRERLGLQLAAKKGDSRMRLATRAMQEFLRLGGDLRMEDLTPALISKHIAKGTPILCGLSSTYLYGASREVEKTNEDDDVAGYPQGHFVMLVGYDPAKREVLVADPLDQNPPYHTAKYRISIYRLVNAVMLGIITHDANLLVLSPPEGWEPGKAKGAGERSGERVAKSGRDGVRHRETVERGSKGA